MRCTKARRRAATAVLAIATVATALAACSTSGSTRTTGSAAPTSTTEPARQLEVVVTNDDGYRAEGIDAIVRTLTRIPGTKVIVVAPEGQNSGAGAKVTTGPLVTVDGKTLSGYAAHAVKGTPADTIRAAFDDLKLRPDLVVSGINQGQNLGPAVDLSGTVGAARAAVARHVPAIAVSAGLGSPVDYTTPATLVGDWIRQHRAGLLDGRAAIEIVSFNSPTCPTGEVRGLRQVPADLDRAHLAASIQPPDCTSTLTDLPNDVVAFHNGFSTESVLSPVPG
ncbi:MAG TPA: 5'/3'-nucleotidase SurE [Acidimicrobiales bacterium]|jgi:5'-nucleotidase|nr:5'/3'-nucleotidase SurE [Acidimicrobiales bacterium]